MGVTKELLIGFTGKQEAIPGRVAVAASYKLLEWDNKQLERDEPDWLRYIDTYDFVLLITVEDDGLVPTVRQLKWNRRLVLQPLDTPPT